MVARLEGAGGAPKPYTPAKPKPKPGTGTGYQKPANMGGAPGYTGTPGGSFVSGAGKPNIGASASGANLPYTDQYGNTRYQGASDARWDAYDLRMAGMGQPAAAQYGGLMGGNSGGGGRAGGGGGGGGPNLDEIRALAGELFNFNADPYNQWRSSIEQQYQFNPTPYDTMRNQANAYNPDFAGMEQQAVGRVQANEAQRSAAASQRLQAITQLINQVGQGFGTNMQSAVRDLTSQGVQTQPYLDQTAAMGANLAQGGVNQLGLGGNLDRVAAQNQADTISGMAQTRLGGEANLANNRGVLLNQIGTQQAAAELANNQARTQALGQLGVQQAQAQMQLEQAKREFMLKYGI